MSGDYVYMYIYTHPVRVYIYIYPLRDYIGYLLPSGGDVSAGIRRVRVFGRESISGFRPEGSNVAGYPKP